MVLAATYKWASLEPLVDVGTNERKLALFLLLDEEPKSWTDLRNEINDTYPGLEEICQESTIKNCMATFTEKGLAVEKEIASKNPKSWPKRVKAWTITKKGEFIQPVAAFMGTYLALKRDVSSYAVFGAMNSPVEKKGPYARLQILLDLDNGAVHSVKYFSSRLKLSEHETKLKLEDLANIENCRGRKRPFVEPLKSNSNKAKWAYKWTARGLYTDEIPYIEVTNIREAIENLRKSGHVSLVPASELNEYRITSIGQDYLTSCVKPALAYLKNDNDAIEYMLERDPSPLQIQYCINVYTKYLKRISSRQSKR